MPKLFAVVEDIETVPEPHRELYTKDDASGKYVLDAEVEGHPAIATLKDTLSKERKRANDLDKRQKAFGDLTPEEAAELRELKRKAAADSGNGGGGSGGSSSDRTADIEKITAKVRAQLTQEFEPIKVEREKLAAENRALKLDEKWRAAALANGVKKEDIEDVMLLTARFRDLQDGKVIVLDEDGDPSPLTPEQFFKDKYRKLKPHFYEPSGAAGSGASGGGGGSGRSAGGVRSLAELKTDAEKAQYISEHGYDAYRQLVEKAALATSAEAERRIAAGTRPAGMGG